MRPLGGVIVLAGLLLAAPAAADIVSAPPVGCPRGTTLDVSHLGAACLAPPPASCPPGSTPRSTAIGPLCEASPACGGGERCAGTCPELALCVTRASIPAHLHPPRIITVAHGACDARGACPEGQTCERAPRCVPDRPPPPAEPPPRGAWGCALAAAALDPVTGALALGALALGALAARRRRRP